MVWHFLRMLVPDVVDATPYPALAAYSTEVERLAAFVAAPHGEAPMAAQAASARHAAR